MARDGTWVLVDAGWYGLESCGFPDRVADLRLGTLQTCRLDSRRVDTLWFESFRVRKGVITVFHISMVAERV